MKHSLVSVFIFFIILMQSHGGRNGEVTESSQCLSTRSTNVRGPTGIPGKPGQKGESGENSTVELANLEKTVTVVQPNITKVLAVIRRGFLQLDDEWISPFSGFQYKILTAGNTWQKSQGLCRGLGGDLASHGLQNWESRRIIFDALNAPSSYLYWVGLKDEGHEGSWRWINGRTSSTRETALWINGEPYSSTNYNCAFIHSSNLLMYSRPCSHGLHALCQKPI